MALSRRTFLRGIGVSGSVLRIGIPALDAMFNSSGTAYAAPGAPAAIPKRFVFWFNGNGIPEQYWVPRGTGWAAPWLLALIAATRNCNRRRSSSAGLSTRMNGR